MTKFIKPNSWIAWIIYFGFLLSYWIGFAFVIFIACEGMSDFARWFTALLWVTITFTTSLCYTNDEGDFKVRKVPLGHLGVIMIGDKIILTLEAGPIFSMPVILDLAIDSIRIKKSKFTIEQIETADPKSVDPKSLGIKMEDYTDTYLNRQMAVGADMEIFYHIESEGFEDYMANVGSDDKFLEIIPAMATGIVSEEFSLRTPAIINNQKKEISKRVQIELQKEIDSKENPKRSWRVKIQKIQLYKLRLPDQIVAMFQEPILADMRKIVAITDAHARGEVIKIEASAREFETIALGRGTAEAETFKLKAIAVGEQLMTAARGLGKAEGYGALAKALKMKEPDLILKLDTMENTFKNIEKVWLPGSPELAGLFGFLPLLGDALKSVGFMCVGLGKNN